MERLRARWPKLRLRVKGSFQDQNNTSIPHAAIYKQLDRFDTVWMKNMSRISKLGGDLTPYDGIGDEIGRLIHAAQQTRVGKTMEFTN